MAKCPHCEFKLKLWHVKAECPSCGVNIPNYDWVNRLEQDSIVAEAAYVKMRQKVARLKYAFVGNKLRIARLPISFLPLFSFLLPLFNVSFYLPFFEEDKTYNIITLSKQVFDFSFGIIPELLTSPVTGGAAGRLFAGIVLIYISLLSLPLISLVFLIRNFKNLHSKGLFVTNLIAGICMITSAALFASFSALQQASTFNAFSIEISFGFYISIGTFLASSAINFWVSKSKVNLDLLNKKIEEAAKGGK
jgi:hypothetical protein